MTPREAIAEYGVAYQFATSSTGTDTCIHVATDCDAVTNGEPPRELTHPGQIPLRARLCKHCDPDVDIRYSTEPQADVPAIEDHDDSQPWEVPVDD